MPSTNETQPALLTQRETADLLGVSKKTMRRLLVSGVLEPVRIAGLAHPRYRRSDVERLVREGSPAPEHEGARGAA